MKIATKVFPLGAIPYDDIEPAVKMLVKLYEKIPYLSFLPKIVENDTIITRSFSKLPGVRKEGKKYVFISTSKSYKNGLVVLDKAFNKPTSDLLEDYAVESQFWVKYIQIIKKFKPHNACINFIGPFTMSQMLRRSSDEPQLLLEKAYRKMFIESICVKALWTIEKIKEVSPNTVPIVVLEEPWANRFGEVRRDSEDITPDMITNMYRRIVEKLKEYGALVAVQSMEKCDWKIPINAGVDIISFDAYNNPNNLNIIPETIVEFIARGGKINWGIVPVMTEAMVKSLNIDYLENRLKATMEGLIIAGVPQDMVYKSALVSVQGDVDHLPIIFAEKALILATQLASRLQNKF